MILAIDPDFQRSLDDFNASQGGPTKIDLCWNPKTSRWQVWAVPQYQSSHPLAQHDATAKLMTTFPDGSGRRGVLLFTWCERDDAYNDIGFKPLDKRLFDTLLYLDTFKDRRHYENTIEEPTARREAAQLKDLRAMAGAGIEYWRKLDSLTISMNPAVSVGGSWRHRNR